MKEAVIVSTARTPIGRAFRGAFNNIKSPTLAAHAIRHAVQRAGVDPAEIDDVVLGTVLGAGTAGMNVARNAALAASIPHTVAAQTVDRQCASGLMALGMAATQVIVDGMQVVVAGGQDNISAVQHRYFEWVAAEADPNVIAQSPQAYMPMLQTAEVVAKRYDVSREAQDRYALSSQQRTAAAQAAGRFDAEIVPVGAQQALADKATGAVSFKAVTLARDEGNRPDTTLEGLRALKPVRDFLGKLGGQVKVVELDSESPAGAPHLAARVSSRRSRTGRVDSAGTKREQWRATIHIVGINQCLPRRTPLRSTTASSRMPWTMQLRRVMAICARPYGP